MKIMLISPLPPPMGGIATWTKTYLSFSTMKENEVYLVNTAVKSNRIKEYKKIRLIEEIKRSLAIFLDIKKNIHKIDIVHLNTSCSLFGIIRDYFYIKYIKCKNIKIVVHYHCNIPDMIYKKSQKYFLKKILKNSDLDLVLNKFSKEYLEMNYKKKVKLVPNFITKKDFLELSKVKIIKKEAKKVLYTGHITIAKGCKDILEIAKEMPEIEFVLAGKINDKEFRECSIKNVTFLGEISSKEIKKQLYSADIFLFMSHTEGFTISLLEAMSAGVPIIATNVGANKDMIENNGGIIVNIQDIKMAKEELKKLASNEILRKKMSSFNIKKVKENYLQEEVLKEIFKSYEDVLNDKKSK